MLSRFSLAAACLTLSVQAVAQPPKATSRELNDILCMTEDQAIAIATSMAAGKTEPIAINDVNKTARAEVCRHYIGYAVVEIEKTETTKAACSCSPAFVSPRTELWSGPRIRSPRSTAARCRAGFRSRGQIDPADQRQIGSCGLRAESASQDFSRRCPNRGSFQICPEFEQIRTEWRPVDKSLTGVAALLYRVDIVRRSLTRSCESLFCVATLQLRNGWKGVDRKPARQLEIVTENRVAGRWT